MNTGNQVINVLRWSDVEKRVKKRLWGGGGGGGGDKIPLWG